MAMADPFRSENLVYRAVQTPEDNDLFIAIHCEPIGFINSNARLKRPQSKKEAEDFQKWVAEETLMGAVICLPSASKSQPEPQDQNGANKSALTAIGAIHLTPSGATMAVHRHAEIGIDIIKEYQGKGYGSEAIRWCLKWAFDEGGLHRVAIGAFEYNEGAARLYEKLGFKREGALRDFIWHRGRWWDALQFSMLEDEWREMRDAQGETARLDAKLLPFGPTH